MPTIYDIIEQARARGTKVKPPKIPSIGQWRKTPKERGKREGRTWKSPFSATGEFFIFANPNKPSQGPIKSFYVTDGSAVLADGYHTRSEAIRGLKSVIKLQVEQMMGQPSSLRVNPPTRAEIAHREPNPLTDVEAGEELEHAQRALDDSDRMQRPENQAYARGMARGTLQTVQRHGSPVASYAATEAIIDSGRHRNPLDEYETDDILHRRDMSVAHAQQHRAAGRPMMATAAAGYAAGLDDVQRDYGTRRPKPKKLAPGELSAPQKLMLETLRSGGPLRKKQHKLTLAQSSVMGALIRKGLAQELKTMWKITAKGRKAIDKRSNPRPPAKKRGATPRGHAKRTKATPRKSAKRPARKNPKTDICRHTMALQKGSKAKLTVCFPRACFSSLKKAVLDIQRELRAQFKQLAKAPVITRADWKWSDKAKTKGRWHFKGKKR